MNSFEKNDPTPRLLDRMGAFASGFCAVHCAIAALLPAAFSVLGLGFFLGQKAEWVFTLTAVLLALGALVLGWRRHRSSLVAGLLALGILALLTSRWLEMGSGHDHHHAEHASTAHSDPHPGSDAHAPNLVREEHSGAHAEGAASDDDAHAAGTAVGVFGGLLLVLGHLVNLRRTRRCKALDTAEKLRPAV